MILVKNYFGSDLKKAPPYSRGSTVYEKNRNNFHWGYEMGEKGQKCRKFPLLDRLLKVTESVHQYLLHVKFQKNFSFFLEIFQRARARQTFDG